MKKFMMIVLFLMGVAQTLVNAASFVWDTKKYFLSSINVAFFEDFHRDDRAWSKEREVVFGVPLVAYGKAHVDAFSRFGQESSDFGLSFPMDIKNWIIMTPVVFNNFQAQELGFGVSASFRFKPPLLK